MIERITGIAPEVRLYIDLSSSRQLISRKGLGKARHLDVSLLWIQKLKSVLVKAIKGVDSPADLGTKALSRDKIKKYLKALGYRGDFVDEEEHKVRRKKTGMKTISVSMIAKIVAVLMSEGISVEGTKVFAEEQNFGISTSCNFGCCLLVLICIVLCCIWSMSMTAAVFAQAPGLGKEKKRASKALKKSEKEKEEMMSEEAN